MLWVLIRSASEVLLMSTHNICFRPEIRKIEKYKKISGRKKHPIWSCECCGIQGIV